MDFSTIVSLGTMLYNVNEMQRSAEELMRNRPKPKRHTQEKEAYSLTKEDINEDEEKYKEYLKKPKLFTILLKTMDNHSYQVKIKSTSEETALSRLSYRTIKDSSGNIIPYKDIKTAQVILEEIIN